MRARSWFVLTLFAIAVLLLVGRAVSMVIVEYEWFASMGLKALWWERAGDTALLQGGLAVAGSLFAFANLTAVRSTILAVAVPQRVGNLELTAMIPSRRLVWLTALAALIVGCALAAPIDDWTLVSLARHGIPFGEIEGYHDRDLGFYVYWLPLEETLYIWCLFAIVVMTALVMVCYAITRSVRMDGRRLIASSHVRRHMSALGALVLLLLAWSYRLDAFDLLREGSGTEGLFLRVDHVVTLRVDLALSILCAVAALLLLRSGWLGQIRQALIVIGGTLLLAVGLRHVLPSLLQRGDTIGDPARRDKDYLATRALVSRRAYDADGVRLVGGDTIVHIDTRVSGEQAAARFSVWDAQSAVDAVEETDARGNEQLDASAPAFIRTDRGTLGMLSVRRPANSGSGEGWRVIARDLSADVPAPQELEWHAASDRLAVRSTADMNIEPLVAPGLRDHRIVVDTTGEIPGPRLESRISRLAHAWNARDPSILSLDSVSPPAVFIASRDVRARVTRVAPIFAQGSEVLPLLYDGNLYWTIELYSASSDYPLSQAWMLAGELRSYFRHAGTALVDAATGRIRIVRVRRPDPIARTWMARTPSLWVSVTDLPAGLANALPPVTDGAIAQLKTLALYGSRYEGAVARHFPDSAFSRDQLTGVLVDADTNLVAGWTVPLLDTGDHIDGIATAVGGIARVTLVDTTTVPRPIWTTATTQLHAALDSARAHVPNGSRREPRVRFGRVHSVMMRDGPLLAQALHQSSVNGAMPVSLVAVWHADVVHVGRTLQDALSKVRGSTITLPPQPPQSSAPEARDQLITRLYDSMRDALRRADWQRFGAVFDSLGRLLGRTPQ